MGNRILHSVIFIFLLILTGLPSWSQSSRFLFSNLDVSDGLSHNMVFSILKDSRGYMWFGTMDGLNRYDGYSFKNYYHIPGDSSSLSRSSINFLFEDDEGKIWMQTGSNIADPSLELNIYNPETERIEHDHPFFHLDPAIPQGGNVKILRDKSGCTWFANHGGGLFRVNAEKNKVVHLMADRSDSLSIGSNWISDLEVDSRGNLWVVNNDCYIEKIDPVSLEVVRRMPLPVLSNPMYWFYIDDDDDIWIFPTNFARGALFYDSSEDTMEELTENGGKCTLSGNDIIDIVQDTEGKIWVGTDHGGITVIDKSDFSTEYIRHNPANDKSLSQNILRCMYRDDEGIIWLGTFKKGISYYHPHLFKFKLYVNNPEDPSTLPFNDVLCFLEDQQENLWIGTDGGGLLKLDRSNDTFEQFLSNPENASTLSKDVIIDLHEDEDGNLWIATYYGGLNKFDGKRFYQYRSNPDDPYALAEDRVWDIFQDSKGRMWVGTLERGLDLFDPHTGKVLKHYGNTNGDFQNGTDVVFTIVEDREGQLWIASAYGAFRFNPEKEEFTRFRNIPGDTTSLSADMTFDVFVDSYGRIWAATSDGLNLYQPQTGSFRVIRESDGLASDYIVSIAEDAKGNLWLGTSKGLSQLRLLSHPEEPLQFRITNYDESDGLQGKELNENAAYRTRRGEMLFGGPDGFVIFDPANLNYPDSASTTVFTNLRIFNRPVRINQPFDGRRILTKALYYTHEIELLYRENLFTLDFSTLDYFHPEKQRYQYKLVGFNNDWLDLDKGVRSITLTNLDPGKYVLRIRSYQGDEDVFSHEASLRIIVSPPFWQTLGFRLISLFVLISLAILWYLKRIRDLERQKVFLQEQVEQRTLEISEKNEELIRQTRSLNEANQLLEERRHKIEEQAEELMAQKNTLEDTNRHLSELNSTKDKFFSIIAHDIKNPFQNVLGFSEILEDQYESLKDEKRRKFINAIFISASSVYRLLENLLQWARSQTNQLKVRQTTIEIDHLIRSNIGLVESSAASKQIRIHFEESHTLVYADPDMIGTILRNLLSNAVKFTPSGGDIHIHVEESGEKAIVTVRDTGVGIDPEILTKLFSVDSAYSTAGTNGETGTGLGLILCKEFINHNHGEIWVTSEVGSGSTFSFSLPIK